MTQLSDTITKAEGNLTGNPVLLAAYNQARVSLAALQTALGTLNAASSQLEQYALTVISTATDKVLANVQNVSAATAPVAAVKPAAPMRGLAQETTRRTASDVATLTLDLQNYSAQADAMSQRINSLMGHCQNARRLPDGGRYCASAWVGIDGDDGSQDVLQAGCVADVNLTAGVVQRRLRISISRLA